MPAALSEFLKDHGRCVMRSGMDAQNQLRHGRAMEPEHRRHTAHRQPFFMTHSQHPTMPGAGTDKTKRWIEMPAPIVVLVEPQLGENIGAAARAMANFGLSRLRLVAPRQSWPNEKARVMAAAPTVFLTVQCFTTASTTRSAIAASSSPPPRAITTRQSRYQR